MSASEFPRSRTALLRQQFPRGVPKLWAPTLAFYRDDGRLDVGRQAAHVAFMAPWIKGILVGGSTGDGWEMEDAEIVALLDATIPLAATHGIDLVVGVLRPSAAAMATLLDRVSEHLRRRAGTRSDVEAFATSRVRAITLAPPTTAQPMTQPEIAAALTPLLRRGFPTALYQLPQVTGNTMQPALMTALSEEFGNLILFKDSGGVDEIARARALPEDVTMLRGAEGDFAEWVARPERPYDGFLLSSANSVPAGLSAMLEHVGAGRTAEAQRVSATLSTVIAEAFAAVAEVPQGNAFANANKALAQVMAYGEQAIAAPLPVLHAGGLLPRTAVAAALGSLQRHGLVPIHPYMAR